MEARRLTGERKRGNKELAQYYYFGCINQVPILHHLGKRQVRFLKPYLDRAKVARALFEISLPEGSYSVNFSDFQPPSCL
jgi:hypothetical protein